MAKFKPCNEDQMVMLLFSLPNQLVLGTVEHTISELVDKHLDLSVFDARYNNDETGGAAIHPKILLKVTLLAYAKGMLSSRQIERACQENIIFIALSWICPRSQHDRCIYLFDAKRDSDDLQQYSAGAPLINLSRPRSIVTWNVPTYFPVVRLIQANHFG